MARRAGSRRLTPKFFKIILCDAQKQKLELPRKFASIYEREMSSGVAYLSVPGGSAWKVQLLKENQRVWFAQGWEAFVKFYSIALGHFLMFKCVGNSIFHVTIFDMSASEIEYPPNTEIVSQQSCPRFAKSETMSGKEGDNPFINLEIEIEKVQDLKKQDSEDCEVSACSLNDSPQSFRSKGGEEGPSWSISNGKKDFAKQPKHFHAHDVKILLQNYDRACDDKRPSFLVKMRPSYVAFHYLLNVPTVFWKKYLGEKHNTVYLQNEKGKVWSVKSLNGKFTIGWQDFVKDNELKVDDVCIFEMIKGAKISFRVVISRAVEQA